MSLMNLDDAPKARKTPTPAMVSPYKEYNGERVTESVARLAPSHSVQTPQPTQSSHVSRSLSVNLRNLIVENADQKSDSHEGQTTDKADSNERRKDRHSIHNTSTEVIRKITVNTFEVLSEPVKESTSRNSVMESDLREEDAFEESFVKGGGSIDRTVVEDEPPQSCEHHVGTTDSSINADVPDRAPRGLVTQRRASPFRKPTLLSNRSKGGENERAEEDGPIPGATRGTDISQPNVPANTTDGSLLFFDKFPWDLLVGLGICNSGGDRGARFGRRNCGRLGQFFSTRNFDLILLLLASRSTRLDQTIDNARCIECVPIALELDAAIIESDNVTGTRGTQLNVMRHKDDSAPLHELSTQAIVKEMVGSMSVDSRQYVIQEQDRCAGIDSSRKRYYRHVNDENDVRDNKVTNLEPFDHQKG